MATPECQHPEKRVRCGVTQEFKETKKGLELWPALYGFCCDCGELTTENRWLPNKGRSK